MNFLEHLDPSPLTFLCTIHHVTLSIINKQQDRQLVGEQYTIEVYVTTNEAILLQCHPLSTSSSLPQMTITVASQSKACLQQHHTVTVPHDDGGTWSLDCSQTDPQEFSTFQDMLTYFVKFENQHQIRNTLAMINPASYQVTQVIAENVHLDKASSTKDGLDHDGEEHEDNIGSVLNDDDFITMRENYYGQKLPVTMDKSVFTDGLELRKVRLITQTAHCMDVGSDWLARGLVNAGDTIADYINSGSRTVEGESIPRNQLVLSSKEIHYFDIMYNLTSMIGSKTTKWISSLFNFASWRQAAPEFRMPTPESKLGNSALQAATRIIEGTQVAASTVFSASRQSLIHIIEKKYGANAGYIAEKLVGSTNKDGDVLVYFDDKGISRRVIMQPAPTTGTTATTATTATKGEETSVNNRSFLVYEDKDTMGERQLVYDIDEFGYPVDEKKPEKIVLV